RERYCLLTESIQPVTHTDQHIEQHQGHHRLCLLSRTIKRLLTALFDLFWVRRTRPARSARSTIYDSQLAKTQWGRPGRLTTDRPQRIVTHQSR
ncbi:hypothetical protein N9I66_03380, partial [Pseudomonadales bacterium]|nr:hypothetical protein [Pseudomonadales bacterium]